MSTVTIGLDKLRDMVRWSTMLCVCCPLCKKCNIKIRDKKQDECIDRIVEDFKEVC